MSCSLLLKMNANQLFRRSKGFSLVELLIGMAIGVIAILMSASLLVAHLQTSAKLEAVNRLQQHWKRIQYLIEQDVHDSTGIILDTIPQSCAQLIANNSSNIVSLQLPRDGGSVVDSSGSVIYYLSGSQLRRCGNSINSDGSLSIASGATSDELVVNNVKDFSPVLANPRVLGFSMTLSDPIGATYSNSSSSTSAAIPSRIVDVDSAN